MTSISLEAICTPAMTWVCSMFVPPPCICIHHAQHERHAKTLFACSAIPGCTTAWPSKPATPDIEIISTHNFGTTRPPVLFSKKTTATTTTRCCNKITLLFALSNVALLWTRRYFPAESKLCSFRLVPTQQRSSRVASCGWCKNRAISSPALFWNSWTVQLFP